MLFSTEERKSISELLCENDQRFCNSEHSWNIETVTGEYILILNKNRKTMRKKKNMIVSIGNTRVFAR